MKKALNLVFERGRETGPLNTALSPACSIHVSLGNLQNYKLIEIPHL